jgi:hypothetical protein
MTTDSAEVVDRREAKAGFEYYVHYLECEYLLRMLSVRYYANDLCIIFLVVFDLACYF